MRWTSGTRSTRWPRFLPRSVHRSLPDSSSPAVSLASVTFAYGPSSDPVIEDLDLLIPRSSHVAMVGPSGIGKSTLTALVAGPLWPTGGSVHVHGHPATGHAAARDRVLIPQEAYVFTATLAENLGHLRPAPVPEAELLAAADAVGLTPLLDRLGGPTAVVDPGAPGHRADPGLPLVRPLALLDQATCHLDPRAEERAERAFARRDSTLVVVAHRISSALRADRVLVMDGRRTAPRGPRRPQGHAFWPRGYGGASGGAVARARSSGVRPAHRARTAHRREP